MVKRHISRLNIPKNWPVARKGIKFITRPSPGPNNLKNSMPLTVVFKYLLKEAKTTKEVKKILHTRNILVNKIVRTDHKFPVGLFDVIEIKKTKQCFRIMLNKQGKFSINEINAKESSIKPCKIKNKTILKNGKIQINLEDGNNLLVDKNEYQVGDTIVLDLEKKKINEHLPFKKGNLIYISGGKKVSIVGELIEIRKTKGLRPSEIIFKTKDGQFETRKKYAIVIGKNKPVIDLKNE